jgi:hypothetical protein
MKARYNLFLHHCPPQSQNFHPHLPHKVEPIYVVEYSDRDREDMDGEELQYAMDFYTERLKAIKQKARFVRVESDEDESYRPSPPVSFNLSPPYL